MGRPTADRHRCENAMARRDSRRHELRRKHYSEARCPKAQAAKAEQIDRTATRTRSRASTKPSAQKSGLLPVSKCACASWQLEHEPAIPFSPFAFRETKRLSSPASQACTRCGPARFLSPANPNRLFCVCSPCRRNLRHFYLRRADVQLLPHLGIHLGEDVLVFLQEVTRILASLPDALAR